MKKEVKTKTSYLDNEDATFNNFDFEAISEQVRRNMREFNFKSEKSVIGMFIALELRRISDFLIERERNRTESQTNNENND